MTMVLTNPRERTRFLRFAMVGIIGAIVDFGIANLLIKVFAFSLVLAGSISFICAILSNFTWNRIWTYPDSRSKPIVKQLFLFAFISVLGLCIRVPVLNFGEPILNRLFGSLPFTIPIFTPDFLTRNTTLAIAVIIVMFWNFFANRYWTYNDIE
jgi:putative flippase GtrA